MFCRGYGAGLHRTYNTMKKQWIYWKIEHNCKFTAVLILLQGFGEEDNPGTEGTAWNTKAVIVCGEIEVIV